MSNDRIGARRRRRVFPPPARFRRAGERPAWPPTTRCAPRPSATSRASGRAWRARTCCGTSRSPRSLDESKAPFYKWFDDGELNASYNCLDRNLENGNADKTAIIFEADDGKVTKVTYKELLPRASAASPTRSRRAASRRATASSSTCRCRSRAWSRCRPARASAPRTRWCSAASRPRRCRSASSTPAPWR